MLEPLLSEMGWILPHPYPLLGKNRELSGRGALFSPAQELTGLGGGCDRLLIYSDND